MGLKRVPYNEAWLSNIREQLEEAAGKGEPRAFDIQLNDEPVIQRTTDLERFDRHEDFISGDTHTVTIRLFHHGSRNCDKYIMTMKEKLELNGTDITTRIQSGIEQAKRDWEFDQMKRQNQTLRTENEQLKKDKEFLEEKVIEANNQKLTVDNLGKVGTAVLTGVLNNTAWLRKTPVGQALAGFMVDESEPAPQQEAPANDSEVTVKKKAAEEHPPLTEAQQNAIRFADWLDKAFSKEEAKIIQDMLFRMSQDKQLIARAKAAIVPPNEPPHNA